MRVDKIDRSLEVMAVAWWKREQWDRLYDISVDRENLEETFEEWEANALLMLVDVRDQVRASGQKISVDAFQVDTEELLLWCNVRGFEVNAESRAAYVGSEWESLEQLEL